MNYRHLLTLAVGISLATTASQGFCTPTVQAKKVNLSVVYAAGPNAQRTKEFKEFLASRFSSVSVVPVSAFKPEAVTGHQVLVVDAPLKLPLDFRRPTILVATAGVMTAMNSKLKFDWYCQCLAKDAHDVDTKHPIFNKPFKVDIQYQDRPMPGHYQMISTPGSLPKVLKTWRVAKIDMNDGTGMIPGMVSTGDGFLDSPDCEVISGGINTKSPEAVAIGRQGSFLMWGFETAPSNMTDSAKDAFTNCVAYIA